MNRSVLNQDGSRSQLAAELQIQGFKTRIVGNTDLLVLSEEEDEELAMLELIIALLKLKISSWASN